MSLYSRLDRLATDVEKLNRQMTAVSNSPQAQRTSIEAGTMDVNDEDGNLVSTIGFQEDGSGATRFFDGPIPPVPVGFTALADGPVIQGTWDGTFEDGAQATYDLAYLEVAATLVDDGTRVSFATITAKEGASAALVANQSGLWAVAVRSVSQAGKKSEFFSAGTVEVKVVDLAGAIEAVQDSANGKNTITWSLRPPTPADPGTVGDTWWVNESRTREDGEEYLAVIAQYQFQAAGWVQVEMAHEVIASVDLGTATVGELDGIRIMSKTVGAEQLSADFADFIVARGATLIAGNDRHRLDDSGYALFDENGDRRTFLSPDGSTFKGEVEADTLVVNGGAELKGTDNLLSQGAKLTLASGVTDPTAPPTVQPYWDGINWSLPAGYGQAPMVGLAFDGTNYWTVRTNNWATTGDEVLNGVRINPTTGASTLFKVPYTDSNDRYGVTCIGSELFWLYRSGYNHKVLVTDLNCVKLREFAYPDAGHSASNPLTYKPGIGTDGTNVVIAHCTDAGSLVWRTYNKTTGALTATVNVGDNTKSDMAGIYIGPGDFGSGTQVVALKASSGLCAAFSTAGVYDTNRSWYVQESGHTGMVFANGKFRTLSQSGVIREYADANTGDGSGDWWFAYRWETDYDNNGTLDYRSRISKPTRATWPRRARMKAIGQPLPAGATGIGGFTAKKTTTPARTDFTRTFTQYRSGESVAFWTTWVPDTTVPADSNTFPNATPAEIASASSTFSVKGDGAGKWGPLTFNSNGSVSGLARIATGLLTMNANAAANGGKWSQVVSFPSGRFSTPPTVSVLTENGRLVGSVEPGTLSATSVQINIFNWTSTGSGNGVKVYWSAVEGGQ